MKYLLVLITLFSIKTMAQGQAMDPAFIKMCQNATKLANVAQIYEPKNWPSFTPVTPYVGIVMGLSTRSSALIEMCDFVLSFEEWNTDQKLHGSKRFLNDLTGRKFQEDFDFFDNTLNFANSVYDFENGERRKGSLSSAQSNRELNQYLKDLREYSNNKRMTEEDKRRQANQQSEVQRLSSLAARKANLTEAMNCPDPGNNPKYGNLYEKDIKPQEDLLREATEDKEFFTEKLQELGQFIYRGGYESLAIYNYNLESVLKNSVTMDYSESSYTEETLKPTKRKDSKGHVIKEKKILSRKYQVFNERINTQVISKFKEQYSKEWKLAVKVTFLSDTSTYGAFAGADERVERSLRNLSVECSERRLMRGVDPDKSDYASEYDKKRLACEASLVIDEKQSENLFEYYLTQLENSIFKENKALAKIWTFESRYLGTNRLLGENATGASFRKEEVKCSNELTVGEMKNLSAKQDSVNTELKEIIAKNKVKKNELKQQKKDNFDETNKEYSKKVNFATKKSEELKGKDRVNSGLVPMRGGIQVNKEK